MKPCSCVQNEAQLEADNKMTMRDVTFCIDRGGTFTDVYCEYSESGTKKKMAIKLLSEDPKNYQSAPREGIRRALEIITKGKHLERGEKRHRM